MHDLLVIAIPTLTVMFGILLNQQEFTAIRSELRTEIGSLRTEMHGEIGSLRKEMIALRDSIHHDMVSLYERVAVVG